MRFQKMLISGLLLLATVASTEEVFARSQKNIAYRPDVVWTTAVRMLRVEMGFQLVERDQSARFVLFRYVDGNRSFPGSLEMVERVFEDGRTGVRVIVAVPAMPTYIELHLLDRLERKLLEEVGPPLPIPERIQNESSDDDDENDADQEESSEEREAEENDD